MRTLFERQAYLSHSFLPLPTSSLTHSSLEFITKVIYDGINDPFLFIYRGNPTTLTDLKDVIESEIRCENEPNLVSSLAFFFLDMLILCEVIKVWNGSHIFLTTFIFSQRILLNFPSFSSLSFFIVYHQRNKPALFNRYTLPSEI